LSWRNGGTPRPVVKNVAPESRYLLPAAARRWFTLVAICAARWVGVPVSGVFLTAANEGEVIWSVGDEVS